MFDLIVLFIIRKRVRDLDRTLRTLEREVDQLRARRGA